MSLDRRLERLEGRHDRHPDMTAAQHRQHELLDAEIEQLIAERAARDGCSVEEVEAWLREEVQLDAEKWR